MRADRGPIIIMMMIYYIRTLVSGKNDFFLSRVHHLFIVLDLKESYSVFMEKEYNIYSDLWQIEGFLSILKGINND